MLAEIVNFCKIDSFQKHQAGESCAYNGPGTSILWRTILDIMIAMFVGLKMWQVSSEYNIFSETNSNNADSHRSSR